MVEMARIWPILCEFVVGGLLGWLGIRAGLKSGYLDLQRKGDRQLVAVLAAGFVGLLALYCAFTFWLPFVGAEAAQ